MSISLCSTSVANTGGIKCDVAPGIPVALLVWNDTEAISAISGSQFQPYMEAASKKSKSDSGKLFVFPIIQDITDKTESNKEGSLNQGFKTVLLEGKPAYDFKVFAGQSQVPQLRKFNNQSLNTLILDNHNRIWGVKSGENFKGAQAKIFTGGLKFATGQNVEEGVVSISLSYLVASELNDDAAFGEVESTAGIVGLLDANLTYVSNVSNVFKIDVAIPTSKIGNAISLYAEKSTQLANAALWVAKTGATFSTALAITSVAVDPALSCWTVTFDSAAYTALASGAKIQLTLADPTTLDAADVDEIEGVPVILTK